jgi:hypothetical protein
MRLTPYVAFGKMWRSVYGIVQDSNWVGCERHISLGL